MKRVLVGTCLCMFASVAAMHDARAQNRVAVESRPDAETTVGEDLLARRVTINVTRVSLDHAVDAAATSAKVPVQYQAQVLDGYPKMVTLHLTNVPLRLVLDRLLEGTSLRVVPDGTARLMILDARQRASLQGESGSIVGKVTDAKTGRPLRGVKVFLDGDVRTTQTSDSGTYRLLDVSAGTQRVHVRLIGYVKQTKTVTVRADRSVTATFSMEPSVNALDQVVVTGTIAETQVRELPNAITVITAKQLEDRGITRIDQLFRGDVPGLFVQNIGTAPKNSMGTYVKRGTVKMYSRGASVLDSASPPIKTYVDGIELADADYLNQIDPSSIERIEIISGPQASAVYGSQALGGVMQIFTKKGRLGQRRPEVTLTLRYGALENNYSSAVAPRHDDELSVSDAAGSYSYRVGGKYYYDGQWTPGLYTRTYGASGGVVRSSSRLDITATGAYSMMRQGASGGIDQARMGAIEDGRAQYNADLIIPDYGSVYDVFHSQVGTSFSYRPFSWWSHSLTLGIDQSSNGSESNGARYVTPADSVAVSYVFSNPQNKTLSYNTTLRRAIGWFGASLSLGGNLSRSSTVNRQANGTDIKRLGTGAGGFMNETRTDRSSGGYYGTGLFSVANTLYLTTGVRAEKNRAFGAKHGTDFTPTWGLSAVRDFGALTLKGRFTYGRATRPPPVGAPDSVLACVQAPTQCPYYTQYFSSGVLVQLANSLLKPESQAGPEWGTDIYFGNRGSLSITHYDQKVRDLLYLTQVNVITSPLSIYSTVQQVQWQNLGDIANNGWLGNGTLNLGPLSLMGSYSWTRSRVLRLNPSYTGTQIEGGSVLGMAEHTASMTVQYSTAKTMLNVSINGTGKILQDRALRTGVDVPRDGTYQYSAPNVSVYTVVRAIPSTSQTSINASRTINRHVSLFLNVMNATNVYRNEGDVSQALYPTLGRQTFFGTRIQM